MATPVMWLLGLTLLLLILGLYSLDQGRAQRRHASRRTRVYVNHNRIPAWRRGINGIGLRLPWGRSVEQRLLRAGIDDLVTGDAFLGVLVLAVLVFALAAQLVVPGAAVLLAIAVAFFASRFLDHLVQKRTDKFAEQLPDIARIMANAAGAGMAIPNALALTMREMEEPAHSLLGHAVRQMEVGQTLAGAMESLQQRAPSREMAVMVSTLIIQQRSGGDVIEALREMSVNLEERRDLKREVVTAMTGVRFTAYIIISLGVGLLFVMEGLTRGTLRRMTGEPLGQVVLVVAFALFAAGYFAVKRLSRVDV